MSTSRDGRIECTTIWLSSQIKPDVLRYALLTNLPETKDSEFHRKDLSGKETTNELVAILATL